VDGPLIFDLDFDSPDPDQVEDGNWLEPVLGKAAFVYQCASVMWCSTHDLT